MTGLLAQADWGIAVAGVAVSLAAVLIAAIAKWSFRGNGVAHEKAEQRLDKVRGELAGIVERLHARLDIVEERSQANKTNIALVQNTLAHVGERIDRALRYMAPARSQRKGPDED